MFVSLFRCFSIATLAAIAPIAAHAQWLAAGRWGTEDNWRYVQPGNWLVLGERGNATHVSVHAEAENHDGRLAFWCDSENQNNGIAFNQYFGSDLERPLDARETVNARIRIDQRDFPIEFSYDLVTREWSAPTALNADLLEAFGWGSRIEVLNSSGAAVSVFRLNGSGAARSALRNVCGF